MLGIRPAAVIRQLLVVLLTDILLFLVFDISGSYLHTYLALDYLKMEA
jgi:hypothetical protein